MNKYEKKKTLFNIFLDFCDNFEVILTDKKIERDASPLQIFFAGSPPRQRGLKGHKKRYSSELQNIRSQRLPLTS